MKFTDVTNLLGITTPQAQNVETPTKPKFDLEKEGEKKVLYKWTTDARHTPDKLKVDPKRNKTLLIIGVVIVFFLAIIQEFFLILVIASIIFIKHVLSATPPEKITYMVTNHGVDYAGQFYYWNELKHFFFTKDAHGETLNADVENKLPARLFLTINPGDKTKLEKIFGSYLPLLEKKPEDFIDKTYASIVDKLDLSGN